MLASFTNDNDGFPAVPLCAKMPLSEIRALSVPVTATPKYAPVVLGFATNMPILVSLVNVTDGAFAEPLANDIVAFPDISIVSPDNIIVGLVIVNELALEIDVTSIFAALNICVSV